MQRSVRRRASSIVTGIDPWLTLAFVALMCLGVLMVYSASIGDAYTYYGSQYYVVERELLFVLVGFIAFAFAARMPYRAWYRIAGPLFVVTLALLALVLTPHVGHASHGAQRWFSLGAGISIEPSELVKLSLILYLARWLPSKGSQIRDFKATFVPFSMIVGAVFLLIVKQPDLGTSIVVALTSAALFYIAGADLRHMAVVAVGSSAFAWILMHGSSYRENRLLAFMNPWKDPTGVGYHTVQALLALGSGGLFGTGLGNSTQKFILPAPHTDSILAVIGEELGFAGTTAILLAFLIVAYRGTRIAMTAPDAFGKLLAAGITCWITFQALLNFAVITSSVPFTGVPLPFVSYGGTSLIITMIAMGILLNISTHARDEAFAHHDSDYGRGDRRTRVSRVVDNPAPDRRKGRVVRGKGTVGYASQSDAR